MTIENLADRDLESARNSVTRQDESSTTKERPGLKRLVLYRGGLTLVPHEEIPGQFREPDPVGIDSGIASEKPNQ
jgi:hypothetical protein